MFPRIGKHRLLLIIVGLAIVVGASLPPFMSASCFTRQQTSAEIRALDTLRALTHGAALPPEDAVTRIETDYPRTKTAGLARLVRSRIKINNRDFSGAAALLDASVIRDHTALGDYALFLRGDALEQAGNAEARTAFEKLVRDYPSSIRARDATLRSANLVLQAGNVAALPGLLRELTARNDGAALLLTAKASEQAGDSARAVVAYRRIYFYAPGSAESVVAAAAIARLGSTVVPSTAEEALTRADRLYETKKYLDANDAYGVAFARFANTANAQSQLRRGIAASTARKTPDAIAALGSVPTSAGETRAQALYYLVQTYAHARQWPQARTTIEEMRKAFPNSSWTPRAIASAGQIADDAKNTSDTASFYRTAVAAFPGSVEVAQAQFNLAWAAHDGKTYQESARLLTEHLAYYADKNTDNRGRAGYWAARDSERAGKIAEARALYEAELGRYDANWYGYLAKQRLDAIIRGGKVAAKTFPADSVVGRAVANLQTVTVAEETAGPEADVAITKADQLSNVGFDDWAIDELAKVSESAPSSPRINLALSRVYRGEEENVRALNTLKKSYPDYSQMKPEELTRAEWDVFYPLPYWDIIVQESRAHNLDPFQVAGLIRQETVFNPKSRSSASAFGLMQVLVPTGRLTARKYGVDRTITAESLYEPRLNIQLGTAYLRDQIDKFGRIEYVAAAYNAGPMRVPGWRATLPAEIDEWVEAVPFKETRLYIQGVVRNRLQYERLYDLSGKLRAEVGSHPVNPSTGATPTTSPEPVNPNVRRRRVIGDEEE